MRLGSQTGSMTNHLYSRMVIGAPEPEVGMGGTIMGWTDRHACTIIEVITKNKKTYIKAQTDTAKRADKNGMSENQEYEYTRNEKGSVYIFMQEKDGRWTECRINDTTGRFNKINGGHGFRIGVRDEYYDFSF